MPRSNSNHKALNIHIAIICALLLMCSPAHAQYFNMSEQPQTESEIEEKAEQEPSTQETEESSNIGTDSPIVELIKSSQTKKRTMRSKDWNNKKYKEKVAKKKAAEKEVEEVKEADKRTTEEIEEELTDESKKIWKHYNQLAKRIKEKKKETQETDEVEEETEKTKKDEEEESKDTTASDPGIDLILKRYKATQKKQGPMNSRSFGSID